MEEIFATFQDKKKFIWLSSIIFIVGIIIGYLSLSYHPEFVISNMKKLMGNVLEISKAMKERNWVYIVGLIFQNNLKALLIVIFGGIVFGIIPFLGILFNGFVVGAVSALNFLKGNSLAFFIASLLPHGILELPVIIVGGAFGLKLGYDIIIPRGKKRIALIKENLRDSTLALGILLPLLFVASIIETVITPAIAKVFL
ncbi:MAG TPA: stage II sporulation protein M [Thermoanaerobacterales bacterium]|jgi:stage II sporulation protein M|nr:stage II sporulation protein M [Thermoanaerobacterales bacterium]